MEEKLTTSEVITKINRMLGTIDTLSRLTETEEASDILIDLYDNLNQILEYIKDE